MSYADRVRVQDLLTEAVLHLLDGAPREWVAREYGFSVGYLGMIKAGTKQPYVGAAARAIYADCRRYQHTRKVLNEH